MKPLAIVHRLRRKVRVLTAQKRRLVHELRAAKSVLTRSPQMQPQPQPKN